MLETLRSIDIVRYNVANCFFFVSELVSSNLYMKSLGQRYIVCTLLDFFLLFVFVLVSEWCLIGVRLI